MKVAMNEEASPQSTAPCQRITASVGIANRLLILAIWLCLGGQVWASTVGTPTIALIGNYNFTISEAALVAGVFAVVTGWLFYGFRRNITTLILLVLAFLIAVNFLRGLLEAPSSALIAARMTLPFYTLLLIGTIRYPSNALATQIFKALSFSALVLVAVVLSRILLGPQFLMLGADGLNITDINDGGRPLPAGGALILAVSGVTNMAMVMRSERGAGSYGIISVASFAALLLTGQGTATLAGLIGSIVVIALEPGRARSTRFVITGVSFALGGVLVLGLLGVAPGDLKVILPSQIADNIVRRQANLGLRELVWETALYAYLEASVLIKALGWPTGATPGLMLQTRSWGWVTWTHSVHSMYVETLIRAGAVGLTLYFGFLLGAIKSSLKALLCGGSALPLAVLIMLILFGYSYSLLTEQAILLAITLVSTDEVKRYI